MSHHFRPNCRWQQIPVPSVILAFSWPNLFLTLSHLADPTAVGSKHVGIKDPADLLDVTSAGESPVPAETPCSSTAFIWQVGTPADIQAQSWGTEGLLGLGKGVSHITLATSTWPSMCPLTESTGHHWLGAAISTSPPGSSRKIVEPTLACGAPWWHANILHPEGERLEAFRLGCHFIVWT